MVAMLDFGFDGVSSSLAEFMSMVFSVSNFLFPLFFWYYVCNPDTRQ